MGIIGSLFSPPKVSMPTPIIMPAAPTSSEEETRAAMEEAARKQRLAAKLAKGRASTLLSGGEGDVSEAPVKLKTLFGE